MERDGGESSSRCPVFGVESGAPIIGLGILIMLFGLVPFFLLPLQIPLLLVIIFLVFGLFLIWIGMTR